VKETEIGRRVDMGKRRGEDVIRDGTEDGWRYEELVCCPFDAV
jgi:hypothetical protein